MAFTLTNEVYREGADRIATVRRVNDPAVVVEDIERALRSYVGAAVAGKFNRDFSDLLSEDEKTRIINAVVAYGGAAYSIRLAPAKVLVDLQLLEVFAGRGEISPALAAPIEWARRGTEYVATAPVIKSKDISTAFGDVVSKFFSGIVGGGGFLPIAALIAVVVMMKKK